jgi:methyl-accepting chemotaxis protein
LVGFPPLVLLLLLWGIVLSHRFAGPLERLKREIEAISKSGDYTKRLRLRRRDELRPLADVINRLLDKVSRT